MADGKPQLYETLTVGNTVWTWLEPNQLPYPSMGGWWSFEGDQETYGGALATPMAQAAPAPATGQQGQQPGAEALQGFFIRGEEIAPEYAGTFYLAERDLRGNVTKLSQVRLPETAPGADRVVPAEEIGGPAGYFVAVDANNQIIGQPFKPETIPGADFLVPQPDGSTQVFDEFGRFQRELAPPEQPPGPDQVVTGPGGERIVLDEFGRFRDVLRPPSLDDLISQAIIQGDFDAALELDDFAKRPSQFQRLQAALDIAQSPADYLTVVGMLRGELPIQAQQGRFQRIGPPSQALGAVQGLVPEPSLGAAQRRFAQPSAEAALAQPNLLRGNLAERLAMTTRRQAKPEDIGISSAIYETLLPDERARADQQLLEKQAQFNAQYAADQQDVEQRYQANLEQEAAPAATTPTSRFAEPLQGRQRFAPPVQPSATPSQGVGLARFGASPSGYPSFLREAVGQSLLSQGAETPRKRFPELGSLPFRSRQTQRFQTPTERQFFEQGLRLQGVPLQDFLEQERESTMVGQARRPRARFLR